MTNHLKYEYREMHIITQFNRKHDENDKIEIIVRHHNTGTAKRFIFA